MRHIGEHAVVIGGSVAGELVARSLTEAHQRAMPEPVRVLRSGLLAGPGRSLAHGVHEHSHPARPPALADGASSSRRRRHGRALPRRSLAPLRQPRLRGEHPGDGRRMGRRRGVRPLVQQRAPRQRPEVPALHRRVRGRAQDRRRVRRRPCRGRRRLRPQHDGGDQRPVGRAAGGHAGALEPGRASLEHASLAAPRSPAAPVHRSADELLDACERALRSARPRIDLVAVTGASNVTGEVWPVAELAELAHAHGAQLFVDAAQLAPHRADRHGRRGHRLPGALGPQALRPVRSRRAGGRPSPPRRASRCCTAAERSSS